MDIIELAMKACLVEWETETRIGSGKRAVRLVDTEGGYGQRVQTANDSWVDRLAYDDFEAPAIMESAWLDKLWEDDRCWRLERMDDGYCEIFVWAANGAELVVQLSAPTRIEAIAAAIVEVFGDKK